jgi:signal transduction histidine kinase
MNVHQKILVLDDVLENDQILSNALKGNGYEVITTDKNKDFDEILESHNPDLILLDTMMSEKVKTILEQKLALQKELQKSQKMASITALTGGIAHNINNLMGAIVGYSDLLRNNIDDNKKSMDFAERILEASERVTALTSDLLTYSRSIRNAPTNVKTKNLINDMLFLYGDDGTKKVNVDIQIPEDIPEICVDIEQICRALGIIFVKAKEATPEKSKVTITAGIGKVPLNPRLKRSELGFEEYVIISIADTGNGIDEDSAKKLSDSFFTINHAVESELELSAASSIIRKNKGFIHVDTKPNIGSTFNVYLPKSVMEAL